MDREDALQHAYEQLTIAAIVPCLNEVSAVGKVVRDLQQAVPGMQVYVYDNGSTDGTARVAAACGALVRHEMKKGKGNVLRRAFADVDADIYLMIDGDDSYDAFAAPRMIEALLSGPYDHVLGVRRIEGDSVAAYRTGHAAGNRLLNYLVSLCFHTDPRDMLSGYRVMSRRFVKSFSCVSREFEIETELTVHTLALRVPATWIDVGFRDRDPGGESKLRTYRDGYKIVRLIGGLLSHERPLLVYGSVGLLSAIVGFGMTLSVVSEYLSIGLVPRLPSLVMAITLMIIGCLSLTAGAVLEGIKKSRHESAHHAYLQYPALSKLSGLASAAGGGPPAAAGRMQEPAMPTTGGVGLAGSDVDATPGERAEAAHEVCGECGREPLASPPRRHLGTRLTHPGKRETHRVR